MPRKGSAHPRSQVVNENILMVLLNLNIHIYIVKWSTRSMSMTFHMDFSAPAVGESSQVEAKNACRRGKNLPNEDLGTDIKQSPRWKGRYYNRSELKRSRSDKSGLFTCSSTQTGSDKQVDSDLKKNAPCSHKFYTNALHQKFVSMEDLLRYVNYAKKSRLSIYSPDLSAPAVGESSQVEAKNARRRGKHVPAGSWHCPRCCEEDDLVGPVKSCKSSSARPESSYSTMEEPTGKELDAAEVLANRMSSCCSYDKNLPNEDLGTDIKQSPLWKGRYYNRSGLKRSRSDKSGLFTCCSTQTGSDKQVDADLKKNAPCSHKQQEAKTIKEQPRVIAPRLVVSDGLIDAPLALGTVQNVVSRRDHLVDNWSEGELDALWIGLRRYGPGNWQMMLDDPMLNFSKSLEGFSLRWEIERQKILDIENDQTPCYPSETKYIIIIFFKGKGGLHEWKTQQHSSTSG